MARDCIGIYSLGYGPVRISCKGGLLQILVSVISLLAWSRPEGSYFTEPGNQKLTLMPVESELSFQS